jgi:hypothetical protein
MKNQTRNYFVKSIFLFIALLMFGCSKSDSVTPASADLSILGKWNILVGRNTENGKTTFDYVGKTGDYVEITNNDYIVSIDGDRFAVQYKVIEKNKTILTIGTSSSGGDETIEIRNLTSTTMTLYQEYIKSGVKYVNYLDLKR